MCIVLVFLVTLLDTSLLGFTIWKGSQELFGVFFPLSIILRKQSRLKNQVEHKESLDKQKRTENVLSVPSAATARGTMERLKRAAAPKHWMLINCLVCLLPDPLPASGSREMSLSHLPNRLTDAQTGYGVKTRLQQSIKTDGRFHMDRAYPVV